MNNTHIIEILGTVAVVATAFLIRAAGRKVSVPTKRRRIVSLDLNPVREKAVKRHGWSEDKAKELEAEYRDFLILIAENDGKIVSPWSDDLDLFWHEHILDTKRYAQDCKAIFGRFIQHDPHIEKNPYRHEETRRSTITLRAAQLQAREERKQAASPATSSDGFDIATWGCSSDSTNHHGSHGDTTSHGSDHSSGHSCGTSSHDSGGGHSCSSGHSCGGHSCGGHGCGGGGCGGH